MQGLIERAKELLADGTVAQVLGWRKGDMGYDPEPAYFYKEEDLQNFCLRRVLWRKLKQIYD